MTKEFKDLLIGLTIGDGGLHKVSPRLQVNHGDSQLDYIRYKSNLIGEITGACPLIITKTYNGYVSHRFAYKHPYLQRVRKWLYRTGTKVITKELLHRLSDREIAIWYMDDGSLYRKKGKRGKSGTSYEICIATYCDTEEEALSIIQFFKQRYDADFTVKRNKSKFSIRCGKKAAVKLLSKLDKFIPECMSHKKFILS